MLHFASRLKKTVAVMTLALMMVTMTSESAMASTQSKPTGGASQGQITPPPVSSSVAAVYGPSSSILGSAKANPQSFQPGIGESTNVHFTLSKSSTVWVDIMQNGSYVNRLFNTSGKHMNPSSSAGYDVLWTGLGNTPNAMGKLVDPGTYQFLITAQDDVTHTTYTAQDNIIVKGAVAQQPAVITVTSVASPNPFNPSKTQTYLKYSLNTQANVNIVVLDGASFVTQLASTPLVQQAGTNYPVSWDGMKGGQPAPAKTYYIQFTASNSANVTPSITTIPVIVDYSSSPTPVPGNPNVTYIYAEYPSFNPNTGVNHIHFGVDNNASAVVKIYDAANNLVKTLPAMNVSAGTDYTKDWDGYSDVTGQKAVAGNYYAKVELSVNGSPVGSKSSSLFAVAYSNGGGQTANVMYVTVEKPTFNPNVTTNRIHYSVDNNASAVVKIFGSGGNLVKTYGASNVTTGFDYFTDWDGRSDAQNNPQVSAGNYYAQVELTVNNVVVSTKQSAQFAVDYSGGGQGTAPVVTSVSVQPTSFNPYNNESTTISYYLSQAATSARVEIYSNPTGSNSVPTVVRTISNTGTSSTSVNTYVWNGRDDSNNVLPVGTYTVKVTATNGNGSGSNTTPVSIINSSTGGTTCTNGTVTPNLTGVSATPSTFNPYNQSTNIYFTLNTPANVTIQVLNNNSTVVRTLSDTVCRQAGSNTPYTWDGRDMYNSNQPLPDGNYTIRVQANNGYGSDTEYTYVTLNSNGYNNGGNNGWNNGINGNIITNLTVQPEIFNPRTGQTANIYYNLNQAATVTTQIVDRNNVVIRTLVDTINRYPNNTAYTTWYGSFNYADQWNGRDVSSNIVPDNIYQFRVVARTPNGITDTQSAWVEVDTDGNIIGFPSSVQCNRMIDITQYNPYCQSVQTLMNDGVFKGYPDSTFRLYDSITRAQMVTVIVRAMGIQLANTSWNTSMGWIFPDVSSTDPYAPFIYVAKLYGIVKGYPDGYFRPTQTPTKVELYKVFLESAGVTKTGYTTNGLSIPYCNTAPYLDTPINAQTRWYIDYVCYAKNAGIANDDGMGHFFPGSYISRGDVAYLFAQFQSRGLANGTAYSNLYGTGTPEQTYIAPNSYSGNVPVVTALTITPTSINPNNNETATIYYALDRTVSSATVQVFDSNNSLRRTINASWTTATSNNIVFNGRDDNNNILSTGNYTIRVTATNNYGTGTSNAANVYINGSGSYNYGNGVPVITALSASPSSFNPNNSESTNIYYALDRSASSGSVQIVDSNNVVRRTIYSNFTTATSNSVNFNGRDDNNVILPAGNYTIRVNATNSYGTGTSNAGTLTISGTGSYNSNGVPVVSSVYGYPQTFNASSGSTLISYTLDRTATSVFVQILDNNNVVRRTIYSNGLSASSSTVGFNGRDDYNNVLPPGTYTVRVNATNYYGTGMSTGTLYLQ